MTEHPRIEIEPTIMFGKPVIAGTRVTVEAVLACLSSSDSWDDVLDAYPQLSREDVAAALTYAASRMRAESVAAE